jgi:stearoyl-CoA desaturase (Delta-9 desaturase)
MTGRTHRNFIITVSVVPPLGLAVGIVLLWNNLVGWVELTLFAVFYFITAIGISVGYHRLLAHRSFKAIKPVRVALAVFGTMAAQGPAITWAAHHRKHHSLADHEGDPHSPHLHAEQGLRGILKGFWHAHLGWLFDERLTSEPMRYVPDLVREKEMRWISQHFTGIVVAGIALPGAIAFAVTGDPFALLTGMLWGGLARIFLLSHATYAVNSLGHIIGRRRFATDDESHNLGWLALPSLGEGFHNNHHAFPNSAVIGLRRSEVDIGALFIRGLERLGVATDVVRPSAKRVRNRRVVDAKGTARPAGDAAPIDNGGRHAQASERSRELVGAADER